MDFYNIISLSLRNPIGINQKIDNNIVYKLFEKAILDTKEKIGDILNNSKTNLLNYLNGFEKARVFEEVDRFYYENDIDGALRFLYYIFETLKHHQVIDFKDDFVIEIVQKINFFLRYQAEIFFNNGGQDRKKAFEIIKLAEKIFKNKNQEFLKNELRKWLLLKQNWDIDKVNKKYTKKLGNVVGIIYSVGEIREQSKEISQINNFINQNEVDLCNFDCYFKSGNIYKALDLGINRLNFFSPSQDLDGIYNPLVICSVSYIRDWINKINILFNDKSIKIDEKYYFQYFDILIRLKRYDDAARIIKNKFFLYKDFSEISKDWKDRIIYLFESNGVKNIEFRRILAQICLNF